MSKAEYRQLPFAFADSPQGDGPAKLSDVSVGKAWLSLKAKGKEGKDSVAWTVDPVRLLESVASVSNLAQALLNVARLLARGVPGGPAAKTVFQRRGIWHRSASYGLHKAYPNSWFAERLLSLRAEWQRLHPPQQVSSQQRLLFE